MNLLALAALLQSCIIFAACPKTRVMEIDCPTSTDNQCVGTGGTGGNGGTCKLDRLLVNKIKGNFGSQSSADEVMVQATVDEADKVDCYVYKTCFFKLPVGCQPTAVTKTEKANPLETVSCP